MMVPIYCSLLSKQIRRVATLCLLSVFLAAGQLFAQTVSVEVLGVPGHERLIENLQEAGYSAYRYGPAGRPASGYEVISIGNQVPPRVAVDVVRRAKREIPTLRYVLLTSDREQAASGPLEIAIGVTNGALEEFPSARPLSSEDWRQLLDSNLQLEEFHRRVRATYPALVSADDERPQDEPSIRPDGILVIPNPDGSATLYGPNGQRGLLTEDGQERWQMQDLVRTSPAMQAGSADQEWIDDMNNWLESIGSKMLSDIEIILDDPDSVENYKALEREEAQTLYERVALRHRYLSILIDNNFNN